MSNFDERRRVPRAAGPGPASQQQDDRRQTIDGNADPAELRRALLLYGTAGAAGTPSAGAGLSMQRAERTH